MLQIDIQCRHWVYSSNSSDYQYYYYRMYGWCFFECAGSKVLNYEWKCVDPSCSRSHPYDAWWITYQDNGATEEDQSWEYTDDLNSAWPWCFYSCDEPYRIKRKMSDWTEKTDCIPQCPSVTYGSPGFEYQYDPENSTDPQIYWWWWERWEHVDSFDEIAEWENGCYYTCKSPYTRNSSLWICEKAADNSCASIPWYVHTSIADTRKNPSEPNQGWEFVCSFAAWYWGTWPSWCLYTCDKKYRKEVTVGGVKKTGCINFSCVTSNPDSNYVDLSVSTTQKDPNTWDQDWEFTPDLDSAWSWCFYTCDEKYRYQYTINGETKTWCRTVDCPSFPIYLYWWYFRISSKCKNWLSMKSLGSCRFFEWFIRTNKWMLFWM